MTRRRLAFLTTYVLLTLAFCSPLFVHPTANGVGDWDQHTFYYASVLRSLAAGQLPYWNPWYCGGNVLWQNPQVPLLSPVFLLGLAMPLALAMKLNIVGHYLAGCLGTHLLLRRSVGVRSPILVVALVVLATFSGGVALHVAAGHSNYLWVLWLPAVLYCFFQACAGSVRSLLLGGTMVGFAVLNGAPHFVPLSTVLLGTLGCVAVIAGRTLKPLLVGILIVVAGCLYASPKLVPAIAFAQSDTFQDRRPVKHPDYMSVEMGARALWDGSQKKTIKVTPGVQLYAWHEYGNYMGWFGAGLAIAAALWALVFRWRSGDWRESASATAVVFMLLLGLGEFAAFAPATLLQKLPLFVNFRIPSRHLMLLSPLGAVCIGFLARSSREVRWSPPVRALVAVVSLVAIVELVLVNRAHLRELFILPPSPVEARHLATTEPVVAPTPPPDILFTRLGENSVMLRSMAAGVSQLDCYEPLLARRIAHPGRAGITAESRVSLSGATFSPNEVTATVRADGAPARVILNQNFADGWSSNAGPVTPDPVSGLPSVELPAGYAGVVRFTFAPPGLPLGLAIWVIAIAVSVFLWRRLPATAAPQG